jgi:hypothetical protein
LRSFGLNLMCAIASAAWASRRRRSPPSDGGRRTTQGRLSGRTGARSVRGRSTSRNGQFVAAPVFAIVTAGTAVFGNDLPPRASRSQPKITSGALHPRNPRQGGGRSPRSTTTRRKGRRSTGRLGRTQAPSCAPGAERRVVDSSTALCWATRRARRYQRNSWNARRASACRSPTRRQTASPTAVIVADRNQTSMSIRRVLRAIASLLYASPVTSTRHRRNDPAAASWPPR